jgi:hypothetical protein
VLHHKRAGGHFHRIRAVLWRRGVTASNVLAVTTKSSSRVVSVLRLASCISFMVEAARVVVPGICSSTPCSMALAKKALSVNTVPSSVRLPERDRPPSICNDTSM